MTESITSFGYWVRRRRKVLDLTQAELAAQVGCSLSMLRKIERDERRPSKQIAELLAQHLGIEGGQQTSFVQMARGQFVPDATVADITDAQPTSPDHDEQAEQADVQPFVGRERELALLEEQLGKAVEGQGRVFFVSGEAGRGKTSLLDEFAHRAENTWSELIIVGGACNVYSGVGDPLLPFREIFALLAHSFEQGHIPSAFGQQRLRLRRFFPTVVETILVHGPDLIDTFVSGAAIEARLNRASPELGSAMALLPQLRKLRQQRAESGYQVEMQQTYLFGEIWMVLKQLSDNRPLLLFLDDLHWADLSSISLLGHLANVISNQRIMIVGSYRQEGLVWRPDSQEIDQNDTHPLTNVLNESQRRYGTISVDLDQLDGREQRAFVDALLDLEPNRLSASFRHRLTQQTQANPLFVVELLREMQQKGTLEQDSRGRWIEGSSLTWELMPARVEAVIEQRLSRIPAELRQALEIASVEGEIFTAQVVAAVQAVEPHALVRSFGAELGRRHWLIQESGVQMIGGQRLSLYNFRHHLFQRYLYDSLDDAERMYLHEAVGKALEELLRDRPEEQAELAVQLAYHFEEARVAKKAADYLLLAGMRADQLYAYEEAAGHLRRALSLLSEDAATSGFAETDFEVRLLLGRVQWKAGDVAEAMDTFQQVVSIARELGSAEALARAVLAYEEPRWRFNLSRALTQELLEEALAAMGTQDSALNVRLLITYARALLDTGTDKQLRTAGEQAVAMARRVGDPGALIDALLRSAHIDRRPENIQRRLEIINEARHLARQIGDRQRLTDCTGVRMYDLLELGDLSLLKQDLEEYMRLAKELRRPFNLHEAAAFRSMWAILKGKFEAAETAAHEALAISEQMGVANVDGIYGVQMFTIRREQDRLAEVAPVVKAFIARSGVAAAWLPGLALIYSDLGLEDQCRPVYEELAADAFTAIPRDSLWATCLTYLAEVCAFLDDKQRAATLYELLLPYEGHAIVVGAAVACLGAATRYLGILATVLSDWNAAERHFEEAMAFNTRLRARPWLAHTLYDYANMRLMRGQGNDEQRARTLLDEALSSASAMNMRLLTRKTTALKERARLSI